MHVISVRINSFITAAIHSIMIMTIGDAKLMATASSVMQYNRDPSTHIFPLPNLGSITITYICFIYDKSKKRTVDFYRFFATMMHLQI